HMEFFINDLSHTFPDDIDFLLLGPNGVGFEFWSDAGGSADIVNGNFIISDSGASLLPEQTLIASGTYRPTDYGDFETSANWGLDPSIIIKHPTPNGTATFASVFGGALYNFNTWTFYVRDDAVGDTGSISAPPVTHTWGVRGTVAVVVKPHDFTG